jgi:hypothetical protein
MKSFGRVWSYFNSTFTEQEQSYLSGLTAKVAGIVKQLEQWIGY